uniref:Uncharacterized protein n=1 Tax=Tanacetum cinerariifolium TaxID=118510 RepID=A0A699TLG3_TANCI|nr:hypothetical protein [Tanacetum cinerariifolium]
MEDQPLPADASPTALSSGYIVNSDLEKDEKDPKEDPAYYPADRGNSDDDESSNDSSRFPWIARIVFSRPFRRVRLLGSV